MKLSRLHIAGFKSFPDRAELGFDRGVTAIVGPNGCGKSNVVDAITWVLGEQSAKSLRGERMEDVIFNGSDARKPTAAAEVRLKLTQVAQAATAMTEPDPLLDETPLVTRDIEIGRRLYRSGESEYLIDGEVCRLRDVHDLLMDSGLGVKAYAVIEQGKIGQILSSRPAERRMLIEEAAGVTKYKARRHAAELKLMAAQQNLTRIDDIIFEVEKQRGALKRQAARARRYKRLREELRRWEQVQFARRYEHLAREIEAADADLEGARTRQAAATAHLAELEALLEAVRLDLTRAESDATSMRERTHAREMDIGRRQQQIQFEKQQVEELGRQLDVYGAEARDLESRRDPARIAVQSQKAAAVEAATALAQAGSLVLEREQDYAAAVAAVQQAERETDEVRAAVLGAETTLSALRQARDHAAAARDRVAAERGRLDIEVRDLGLEADRAHQAGQRAEEALAYARQDVARLGDERSAAETALARATADRESLDAALASRQRELASREARLRSLEELEANRASFGDAARYLLADSESGIRHHGAVADHLDVERPYGRAVDALLGDLLQHVVVDGSEDVGRALARLADRDAGRCGFVVAGEVHGEPPHPAMAAAAGARTLRDVARATGPHASTIARVIGDALIVESFDQARALARTASVPVATLAGEVCRGAWIVEGGARRDARGILETRDEMGVLRDEVRAGEADTARMAADLAALTRTIADTRTRVDGLIADLHAREKDIVGLEGQAARASEEQARVSRRLDVVVTEQRRAQAEERAADERREEAMAAITAHESQQAAAGGRLGELLARLQAARAEAEARLRLVTEAGTRQAALTERVSALDVEVQRLVETAADLEARLAGRRQEIQRAEERREELRRSIRDTELRLDDDIGAIGGLTGELRSLDERVSDLRTRFSEREHNIRTARHALDGVRTQVMQAELARTRAASDLQHLGEACLEAVNASIDDVVAEVARMERDGELSAAAGRLAALAPDEPDEDEMAGAEAGAESDAARSAAAPSGPLGPEDMITGLRRKLERLGPVNMMAIEQFDELESRHTFLTTQRKDLLDSIAQTGEAIRKIDKTTRERFAQAFESINTHFETTFTTLFGGGRAGLVLIDLENDSDSGIDIIAQPPGKRLQNVQLLSGGEKALTAMALMFAIFKYRPSPFCLLDEIDAPLDDANIGRFVEMLQGMQDHTQFILITHNRKTMEIADRLYGVTMEEPGVSKLISLQLN